MDWNDILPLSAWRLLFVIICVITIALGVVFGLQIPDNPSKAWCLSEKERLQVLVRIRDNIQGYGNRHFKMGVTQGSFHGPEDVHLYCV
jgi:ACS family allantoate permease-like MFS transporter